MRRITDSLIGMLTRPDYRLEIWRTSAPKMNGLILDDDYFYLTKINHKGEINDHSIGLPATDLPELLAILSRSE